MRISGFPYFFRYSSNLSSLLFFHVQQTLNRKRPTFGGYSTKQEMCLSFITYYPKIDLAGCYSMTPVKEFFEIFGVYEFYSMNMTDVENLFLYNGYVLLFGQKEKKYIKKNPNSS